MKRPPRGLVDTAWNPVGHFCSYQSTASNCSNVDRSKTCPGSGRTDGIDRSSTVSVSCNPSNVVAVTLDRSVPRNESEVSDGNWPAVNLPPSVGSGSSFGLLLRPSATSEFCIEDSCSQSTDVIPVPSSWSAVVPVGRLRGKSGPRFKPEYILLSLFGAQTPLFDGQNTAGTSLQSTVVSIHLQ